MSLQSFSIAVLRPEECFRLRIENIRDGANNITYGKTRAARRRIPMTPRVGAIIENRIASEQSKIDRSLQPIEFDETQRKKELEGCGWLFPAATRSGHMEGSSVKKQQARAFRLTGINPFELYCLRHTCLTRWTPKMDPFTLAYLAGHTDFSITKRYVHQKTKPSRLQWNEWRLGMGLPTKSPTQH